MTLTCGIALCTYNGQQYLEEQLESIFRQTRKPDAIVVFDDCSTDGTWDMLRQFQANSPIPMQVFRNASQQGVVRNFESAISRLETDLIFLCDQDDIWLPDKVAALCAIFDASPETNLVFTNAVLVDEQGRELGSTLFEELAVNRWEARALEHGRAFDVLSRRNVITGATAALRRSILSVALPFPDVCLHDEWLGLIAAATGKVVKLSRPTIKYRQHGRNVVGVKKLTTIQVLKKLWWSTREFRSRSFAADKIRYRATLTERLKSLSQLSGQVGRQCQESVRFAQFRASLPDRFVVRCPMVLWKALEGQYLKFGYWWKSDVFRDLIHK